MNILLGYDGSDSAREAVNLAKKHAKAFGAKVLAVTSLVGGAEVSQEEIDGAEEGLKEVQARLEAAGVDVETHLLVRGMPPGEDIIEFAKERNTEEIILGVNKKSRVGKFLFGSTAQFVILEATCPVVAVKA